MNSSCAKAALQVSGTVFAGGVHLSNCWLYQRPADVQNLYSVSVVPGVQPFAPVKTLMFIAEGMRVFVYVVVGVPPPAGVVDVLVAVSAIRLEVPAQLAIPVVASGVGEVTV